MNRNYRGFGALGSVAGILLLQAACASDESAAGSLVVQNRMRNGLTAAQLASVDGSYGDDCTNRTGPWSAAITGGAMTHPPLSVVMNDTDCVLTLTAVNASTTGSLGTLAASPTFELTTSYQLEPSTFGTPLEFYANAQLSTVSFAAPFTLTLLYSDDPGLAVASNTAQFQVTTASVTAQAVPAPAYTLNVTGLIVTATIDDLIVSASGNATLTDTGQDGQDYVVLDEAGLNTYVEIDEAYLDATEQDLVLSIPAADFALTAGLQLPQARTLIIANLLDGVRSYKAFEITFNAPAVIP
jgi:hypothetical protein